MSHLFHGMGVFGMLMPARDGEGCGGGVVKGWLAAPMLMAVSWE